jgi:inhibitor of cysteine peptidase
MILRREIRAAVRSGARKQAPAMSMVTLTMADNGRAVDAGAADEVVLHLPENPTTGYRWQLERAADALELTSDTYHPAPPIQFGSGGMREFRFRKTAPGTARLELKHWQAWEGDRSITERFAVTLTFSG